MSEKDCEQISHNHEHIDNHAPCILSHATNSEPTSQKTILTIRSFTGLSGDMLCCGLGSLWLKQQNLEPTDGNQLLNDLAEKIMPALQNCIAIEHKLVNGIGGYYLRVDLPRAHEHRTAADIYAIIEQSGLDEGAKNLAKQCVALLAKCEANVHGKSVTEIHFHEVGALDSILDICLACALYEKLDMPAIVSSPLPMADGAINCAHGSLPAPAPAVLAILPGMRVKPFAIQNAGELVTPTAIALLHTLNASFGPWPEFYIDATALVYGSKEFADVPNGVIFALGKS